jgi:hypothetical protein
MAVASVSRIRKRVIELLLAAGRGNRYADAVGDQKRYTVLQEITDAVVESDMQRCAVIISTVGHPYRAAFMTPTANLASGDFITPAGIAQHGKVEIDPTGGGTFKAGRLAKSHDHLLEVIHHPALFPNSKRWYWIEDSCIEHSGSAAKVWYPSFTKTDAACQAHELYTPGVMCGAIALLRKDGGDPTFYDDYAEMAAIGDQFIAQGVKALPSIEELRLLMREGRGKA